ncbi:transposase [Nonomuraea jabiensis]|uniref:transposase n=1 Tax=Nonomuraea jabiensis TaxID=882448 RepID=UPI0036CC4DDB
MGPLLGARVLAEFGDDPTRYASAKARKNYAGISPVSRASGKKKIALARFIHNDRLIDALLAQAFSALRLSPGVRASYDRQRARGTGRNAGLRQLANRLVGILHGCLKTGTLYDETTAWSHHAESVTAWHQSSQDVFRVCGMGAGPGCSACCAECDRVGATPTQGCGG